MPGTPYGSWYSASKHALNVLTEAMYLELDGIDVRVACIEPGFFRTDITRNSGGRIDEADPYAKDQAWLADFFDKSVIEGGGDPVDVAETIVRAAHDPATPVHNLVGDECHHAHRPLPTGRFHRGVGCRWPSPSPNRSPVPVRHDRRPS